MPSALYCLWAVSAIGLSLALAGLTPESITRLLVILFLFGQWAFHSSLVKVLHFFGPKTRFIAIGVFLAAVVEGFHMISMPVFLSLRVESGTSLGQGLINYGLDLLFTLPAYLIIFSVIWFFISRYDFPFWRYAISVGFAQTLGDGGLFYFLNNPWMIAFLPYPMTNYHAINIMPFLAVRDSLPVARIRSGHVYLVIPVLIGVYLVCGSCIKILGRAFGLE